MELKTVKSKIEAGEFWRDRSVFITGASGLLGGWLLEGLLALEARPVCLLRDWTPNSMFLSGESRDRVDVVVGEVQDEALLERVLGEYEVSTVFHLAAQTIVGVSNRNPTATFDTNVRGTWTLLEACRRSPLVTEVVVASSDKAYGSHHDLPYVEETPLRPQYPYDVSKACADLICGSYAKTFGVPVVVSRCGNLFGGGDLNWNRIVPGTIRSVLRGQRPEIRSDGQFIRDYLYIEDAVDAYLQLAQCLSEKQSLLGEAFNFSTESQITVIQLVHLILELMGSSMEPVIQSRATNEIASQYLSSKKARDVLNWEPVLALNEGLARTISWYKDHLEDAG
jgi:CDP-glucose 4,6-dehydratase